MIDLDLKRIVSSLREDGWALLPQTLSRARALHLAERMEEIWSDKSLWELNKSKDFFRGDVSIMRLFEHDKLFIELAYIYKVIRIVRVFLGRDCHIISQNGLRTGKGQGIVNWHIDDELFFPYSMNSGRPWSSENLPVYSLSVMFALTDIAELSDGPTQVVPRSHLSGCRPSKYTKPENIHSIITQAGDAYIFNSQIWHRGAQNFSGKRRYVITNTYGRRFISQRFYPFVDYRFPRELLKNTPDELKELFGYHRKGPYG